MPVLEATRRLVELSGTRGEERARALLDAAADVAERVYKPYLGAIWMLADLVDGRAPRRPPKFGSLVQTLIGRPTLYSALVEQDAAHVRNAIVHGRATYVPKKNAIEMRDANGWSRVFRPAELEALTRRMLRVGARLYPLAVCTFAEEALLLPLLPDMTRFLRAVAANDEAASEAIGTEIERLMHDAFAEVRGLLVESRAGSA